MKLTGETKLFIGIALVTLVLIGAAMVFFGKQANTPAVTLTKKDLIPEGTYTRSS
jgi:hypothetical protein